MKLFTERDWDFRAGIITEDGELTWQCMTLAVILPWVCLAWML